MKKVFIVEDDEALIELLTYTLKKAGYETFISRDGNTAVDMAIRYNPDIILMDWMLPKQSGLDAIRKIRRKARTYIPIIMLTARAQEEDKIDSLTTGADDYVTKPFSPKELLARIHAVLRCKKQNDNVLSFKDIRVDMDSHTVKKANKTIELNNKEYLLLLHFLKHPKFTFTREQLLDSIWGMNLNVEIRTVDVHIARLRKTLGSNIIRTIWSVGYTLDTPS